MDRPRHRLSSEWERVTEALCAWGASPMWHTREDRLYWLDSGLKRLWRWHPPSGQTDQWDLAQEPTSIVPCRSGGLLIAMRDGVYHASTWQDLPRQVATARHGDTTLRLGEGKCDVWGRFWVSGEAAGRPSPNSALYCLHTLTRRYPEMVRVTQGTVQPHGLAWSPDGHTLYWIDTVRHTIEAQPMHAPGQFPPEVGPPLNLARFPAKPDGWHFARPQGYQGRPNSLAVDRDGNCWVAMYEGARVLCLDPKGTVLTEIDTPTQCPTDLTFGGHDLRTLYLTTARAQRSSEELAQFPASGAVFSLRVDTPGLPTGLYGD